MEFIFSISLWRWGWLFSIWKNAGRWRVNNHRLRHDCRFGIECIFTEDGF